jgi:hypothetical protein
MTSLIQTFEAESLVAIVAMILPVPAATLVLYWLALRPKKTKPPVALRRIAQRTETKL